jgi:hypothetical protein
VTRPNGGTAPAADAGTDASARPDPVGRTRRYVGLALLLSLVGLAVLLVVPQPAPPVPEGPTSGPATWSARGSLAGDARLVREATQAWRLAADGSTIATPGPQVAVLYAGPDRSGAWVVLRSAAPDGSTLVALVRAEGLRVRVVAAQPVDPATRALVLAQGPEIRLLVPPAPRSEDLVVRRGDGLWQWVDAPPDGLSAPVRGLDGAGLLLGVVGEAFGQRGLLETMRLSPASVVPLPDRLEVVSPAWGRSSLVSDEEYDDASAAAPALTTAGGEPTRLAVLASTGTPADRVVVVEVPRTDGSVGHLLVLSQGGSVATGLAPVVRDGLAVGVVPRPDGRTLVLVGSSPAVARVDVRDPAGTTLVTGRGDVSVVLPAPAPPHVVVVGTGPDGSEVARLQVALPSGLDETGSMPRAVVAAGPAGV